METAIIVLLLFFAILKRSLFKEIYDLLGAEANRRAEPQPHAMHPSAGFVAESAN